MVNWIVYYVCVLIKRIKRRSVISSKWRHIYRNIHRPFTFFFSFFVHKHNETRTNNIQFRNYSSSSSSSKGFIHCIWNRKFWDWDNKIRFLCIYKNENLNDYFASITNCKTNELNLTSKWNINFFLFNLNRKFRTFG